MLVNTHNPESCAYRGEAEDEALVGALEAIKSQAPEHGLEWRGSWVNRTAHEIFMLVDAPNGHVIEQAMVAAGLVGRTHTRILPVFETQAVIDEDR
jgi:hypothetical protein